MKKILVVEDEILLVKVLRRVLEREGYGTLDAPDISTAKRLLLSEPVDLLLSDIDLPGGTGLELCRWTRGQPTLRATKVILTSGRLEPDLERKALEAGAVACMAKPFDLDQFRATIRSQVPLGC